MDQSDSGSTLVDSKTSAANATIATSGTTGVFSQGNQYARQNTDAGAANVKTGTSYVYEGTSTTGTYDGSDRWTSPSAGDLRSGIQLKSNSTSLNLTGTMVAPSLANTKIGVAGDGGTGTYDGSDRWTSPSAGDLRSGTQLKSNSTSLNLTGTMVGVSPSNTKHGVAADGGTGTYRGDDLWEAVSAGNLKHGVTKLQDGSSVTGTYRGEDLYDPVAASDLKIDVEAQQDGTLVIGEYDGSDRWTSIPESKVEIDYEYKDNSLVENRIGSLDPEAPIEIVEIIHQTSEAVGQSLETELNIEESGETTLETNQ
jgi:hypothetical protein